MSPWRAALPGMLLALLLAGCANSTAVPSPSNQAPAPPAPTSDRFTACGASTYREPMQPLGTAAAAPAAVTEAEALAFTHQFLITNAAIGPQQVTCVATQQPSSALQRYLTGLRTTSAVWVVMAHGMIGTRSPLAAPDHAVYMAMFISAVHPLQLYTVATFHDTPPSPLPTP